MIFKTKMTIFRLVLQEHFVFEQILHFSHFQTIESIINVEIRIEASMNIYDVEKIVE